MGQELNCSVVVNDIRVQTTEKNIFRDMEVAFAQFMNDRKWTNQSYKNEEKIKCNLAITIDQNPSLTSYTASVQVQSARPVYGTNYETLILNFADRNFEFEYTESQPLNFSDNVYTNNITSMLAFYAYIIIGMDMDTFGKMAGNPWFERARDVVINAQQSNRQGWNQFDSNRNRYWLQENLNNQQLFPIREGMYEYHRVILDQFADDPDGARKNILEILKDIQKVQNINRNRVLIIAFFDAKVDELVNIFKEGDLQVRRQAYDILVDIQPSRTSKFEEIIKN
jgi:hypothetical protein